MAQEHQGNSGAAGTPGAQGALIPYPTLEQRGDMGALRSEIEQSRHRFEETLGEVQEEIERLTPIQRIEQLRHQLEHTRAQALRTLTALDQYADRGQGLQRWVQRRPLEAVGVAFGLGLILGARPFQ